MRLWDAVTRELRDPAPSRGRARAGLQPGQRLLVSGAVPDDSLRIWDVATAQLKRQFKRRGNVLFQGIAVSPDGAHIAAKDDGGNATIMEAATGARSPFVSDGRRRRQEVAGLQSRRTIPGGFG